MYEWFARDTLSQNWNYEKISSFGNQKDVDGLPSSQSIVKQRGSGSQRKQAVLNGVLFVTHNTPHRKQGFPWSTHASPLLGCLLCLGRYGLRRHIKILSITQFLDKLDTEVPMNTDPRERLPETNYSTPQRHACVDFDQKDGRIAVNGNPQPQMTYVLYCTYLPQVQYLGGLRGKARTITSLQSNM